jgi:lysyl-tRNA synthetase, class II
VPTRYLTTNTNEGRDAGDEVRKDIRNRKKQIDESSIEVYPRFTPHDKHMSMLHFRRKYNDLKPGGVPENENETQAPVEVHGRVLSIRLAGKRLAFIDIVGGRGYRLQVLYNFGPLERKGTTRDEFARVKQLIHRGDIISIVGHPHKTDKGELSIKAIELPKILSTCLHDFPAERTLQTATPDPEQEWQKLNKHVEMLINQDTVRVMVQRSAIISHMRNYFKTRDFMEVQTPILAAAAGGAMARPFETVATEFPEKKLALRVAPELWLKRLIIGGLPKVFEIGPCFRNEGLDKTHNPEFTSCEFYAAFTSLPDLISTTESLFLDISTRLDKSWNDTVNRKGDYVMKTSATQKMQYPPSALQGPWPQIDFVPALNAAMEIDLPNLVESTPETLSTLLGIFKSKSIPVPENATLPRLLDKLSSSFLESQCEKPTWIINIPECMSPLSKSFIHPTAPNNQPVAARAELFIAGREIVNCYEEENDPFEQRRKFKMQSVYGSTIAGKSSRAAEVDPEAMKLDEDYLRALEWGLPPTGGWGCGIDRLVMLFTGKEKIGDVLSFGSLRAVTRTAEKWKEGEIDFKNSRELEIALRERLEEKEHRKLYGGV